MNLLLEKLPGHSSSRRQICIHRLCVYTTDGVMLWIGDIKRIDRKMDLLTYRLLLLDHGQSTPTNIQVLELWREAPRASPHNCWIIVGNAVVTEPAKLTSELVFGCIMATSQQDIEWIVSYVISAYDDYDNGDNDIVSWMQSGYLWIIGYY